MLPEFNLFGYTISSYSFMALIGALMGVWIPYRGVRRLGWSRRAYSGLVFFVGISFLVGARLLNVLVRPGVYGTDFPWYSLRFAGFSLYGGILAGLAALLLYTKLYGKKPLPVLDAVTPGGIVAFCFARTGCFLTGCCAGCVTASALGVPRELSQSGQKTLSDISNVIPLPFLHESGQALNVWPTQLFELGGALLGLLLLLAVVRQFRLPQGGFFLLNLSWFSLVRLLVLPLRALDYRAGVKEWAYPLLYSLMICSGLIGCALLYYRDTRRAAESLGDRRKVRRLSVRATAVVLSVALVFAATGCSYLEMVKNRFVKVFSIGVKEESFVVSPDAGYAKTDFGVTVDLGKFVLDEKAVLKVEKQAVVEERAEGATFEPYEVSLGDMHELGTYVSIRVPYDREKLKGKDPWQALGAAWMNPETGGWEPVLYDIDEEAGELIIQTKHLSTFSACYLDSPGSRYANVIAVKPDSVPDLSKSKAFELAKELSSLRKAGKAVAEWGQKNFNAALGMAEWMGNAESAINLATLGKPVFENKIHEEMFGRLGKIGMVAFACKSAYFLEQSLRGELSETSDADFLLLLRDGLNIALGLAEIPTLNFALAGAWALEKLVYGAFVEARNLKVSQIGKLYDFYYDQSGYEKTTMKEWRKWITKAIEKYPNDAEMCKNIIESAMNRYVNKFWTFYDQEPDKLALMSIDLDFRLIPEATEDIRRELSNKRKKQTYAKLKEVMISIQEDFEKDTRAKLEQELKDAREEFNAKKSFEIQEKLEEGAAPKFGGYTFRFGPLGPAAEATEWTGVLDDKGVASFDCTLAGFLSAGEPETLEYIELFKPGQDPDIDPPEMVVPIQMKAGPTSTVEIGGGPSFDEIMGDYLDGTLMLQRGMYDEARVSAIKEERKRNKDKKKNKEECDFDLSDDAFLTEKPIPMPFRLTKTGENKGTFVFLDPPGEESKRKDHPANFIYDAVNNKIIVQSEAPLIFQISYSPDQKSIVLLCDEERPVYEEDPTAATIRITIKGSKPRNGNP